MLDYTKKGTYQDSNGFTWVFYGDTDKSNYFYIIPQPSYVFESANTPIIKLVEYQTNDQRNGSGFLHIATELVVPPAVKSAILQKIPQQFPAAGHNIIINALDYNPGAEAVLTLTTDTGSTEVVAPASEFGGNTTSFTVQLTKAMLQTVTKQLTTSGGGLPIKYRMSVPAQLPAVKATLTFDSAIAYKYQVTHEQEHTWSSPTPRSVKKLMTESASSHVHIKWYEQHPPQSLITAVTDWANQTLQTELTNKVNEALAIYKDHNYNSFSINQVSNFTSVFDESQVVAWWVYPTATLPSLADLGLNLDNFKTTVNEQQQAMTISAHLPFTKDSSDKPNVPKHDENPLLIDQVVVTVDYPGLSQQAATYTFTENGAHLFSTAYNVQHGPSYNLSYAVTFKGNPTKVTGSVADISQGQYALKIPSVGILTIDFDASQAFVKPQGQVDNALEEINIDFSYVNSQGLGTPVVQRKTIKKADTSKMAKFTSFVGHPINAPYNYTLEYVFAGGLTFTAPTKTNANGFREVIPAPAYPHTTNLIIAVERSTSSPPLISADVAVWYETAPDVPTTARQPTKASPALFNLKLPEGSSKWAYAQDHFEGFLNGNQPLMYSATINSLAGQTVINDQKMNNTQSTVMVTPTQRYFTLELDPQAIDWKTAKYSAVQIKVLAINGGSHSQPGTKTQHTPSWNKGESDKKYLTFPMKEPSTDITFTYTLTYVFPGDPTGNKVQKGKGGNQGASGTQILDIPATAGTMAKIRSVKEARDKTSEKSYQ